jgi:hypothetical protein
MLIRSLPRTGDYSMWTGNSGYKFILRDEDNGYYDFFGYTSETGNEGYIIIKNPPLSTLLPQTTTQLQRVIGLQLKRQRLHKNMIPQL